MQVFANACEGYHQVVQAVLEFYEVRTKEAGRAMAIQRVSADLKLSNAELAAIIRAHDRRTTPPTGRRSHPRPRRMRQQWSRFSRSTALRRVL